MGIDIKNIYMIMLDRHLSPEQKINSWALCLLADVLDCDIRFDAVDRK